MSQSQKNNNSQQEQPSFEFKLEQQHLHIYPTHSEERNRPTILEIIREQTAKLEEIETILQNTGITRSNFETIVRQPEYNPETTDSFQENYFKNTINNMENEQLDILDLMPMETQQLPDPLESSATTASLLPNSIESATTVEFNPLENEMINPTLQHNTIQHNNTSQNEIKQEPKTTKSSTPIEKLAEKIVEQKDINLAPLQELVAQQSRILEKLSNQSEKQIGNASNAQLLPSNIQQVQTTTSIRNSAIPTTIPTTTIPSSTIPTTTIPSSTIPATAIPTTIPNTIPATATIPTAISTTMPTTIQPSIPQNTTIPTTNAHTGSTMNQSVPTNVPPTRKTMSIGEIASQQAKMLAALNPTLSKMMSGTTQAPVQMQEPIQTVNQVPITNQLQNHVTAIESANNAHPTQIELIRQQQEQQKLTLKKQQYIEQQQLSLQQKLEQIQQQEREIALQKLHIEQQQQELLVAQQQLIQETQDKFQEKLHRLNRLENRNMQQIPTFSNMPTTTQGMVHAQQAQLQALQVASLQSQLSQLQPSAPIIAPKPQVPNAQMAEQQANKRSEQLKMLEQQQKIVKLLMKRNNQYKHHSQQVHQLQSLEESRENQSLFNQRQENYKLQLEKEPDFSHLNEEDDSDEDNHDIKNLSSTTTTTTTTTTHTDSLYQKVSKQGGMLLCDSRKRTHSQQQAAESPWLVSDIHPTYSKVLKRVSIDMYWMSSESLFINQLPESLNPSMFPVAIRVGLSNVPPALQHHSLMATLSILYNPRTSDSDLFANVMPTVPPKVTKILSRCVLRAANNATTLDGEIHLSSLPSDCQIDGSSLIVTLSNGLTATNLVTLSSRPFLQISKSSHIPPKGNSILLPSV